jgi:anti-anti-sigma factor
VGGLQVAVRRSDPAGIAVVRCEGEVDISTVEELRFVLDDLLVSHPSGVAVDLRDVSFIDSSGLRCLLEPNRSPN